MKTTSEVPKRSVPVRRSSGNTEQAKADPPKPKPLQTSPRASALRPLAELFLPAFLVCGMVTLLQVWNVIPVLNLGFLNHAELELHEFQRAHWQLIDLRRVSFPWLYPLMGAILGATVVRHRLFPRDGSTKRRTRKNSYTAKLGNLVWDRNSFCRGWLITGATGTGKTQVGVNVLMHQLFENEVGVITRDWGKDELAETAQQYSERYYKTTQPIFEKRSAAYVELMAVNARIDKVKRKVLNAQLRVELGHTTDTQTPTVELQKLQSKHAKILTDYEMLDESLRLPREEFSRRMFAIEKLKFDEAPWGGVCMDEKGLYWQTLSGMARFYDREHHLCLLQTRPDWAPKSWRPVTRFNLLSDYSVPANTYADAIVETATAIAGGEGDKGFFKTQAQTQIGKAIELCREIRSAQLAAGTLPEHAVAPNLKLIYDLLKSLPDYTEFLVRVGVVGPPNEVDDEDPKTKKPIAWIDANGQKTDEAYGEPTLGSPEIDALVGHFQKNYWSQPKDQLGGVIGTLQNYLAYFQTKEIAEVFCEDPSCEGAFNTFELDDIEAGKIICVAMPQKLSIERRYICTILKILSYKLILRRFDKDADTFKKKNLVVIWQDEVQRFIIKDDGNVDVIREAGGTTVMATQSKASLYPVLGGKEKANPILLNLRNRIILRAADDDCALASSEFMGKIERQKKSHSTGKQGTSYSYSTEEQFIVKPHQFRNIPDFCALIYHANGKWRQYCIQPRVPDGSIPLWWFGGRPLKGKTQDGKPIYGPHVPPAAPAFVRFRKFIGFKTDFVPFRIPKLKAQ